MKKSILALTFLLFTGIAFSQTTVTLQDQCNCEVLKGTDVSTSGAVTPTGADLGDIYVNTNTGTIYFWDGDSWELTATDDQQLTGFNFDGVTNTLSLTLENGGTVNVDLSSLSDVFTDTNTTIASFGIDGTNTNLVITDSEANTFAVALVDLAALINTDNQTLTEVLSQGNDAGGATITNLAVPVNPQDAATKAYVDSVADDDITGVSFDGGTNEVTVSEGGTSFSADLSSLDDSAGVAANAADIANNTTAIGNNATDISNNATNISNNTTAIGNNASNITANASDIANNTTNISNNASAIATNASDIANNTTNISNNASAIATNTSDISNNTTAIGNNAANITTNATDIATNATNLANHISADGDLSDTNEIQNIEEVLTDGNDANGLVLTGLGAPTAASDAATKAYVDSVADDDITGVSFDGGTNEVTVSEGGTSFSADLSSLDDSAGVSANAADIANNTTAIGNNASNISTNTTNISNNASAIATNTSDIANNTTAIGNNATDIANHIAADADTNIGNEYNTGSSITDGVIGITDGGGTESIDLISSDLNNNITFGSDGALYLNVASVSIAETNTSLSYNDATGELTYSNELGNNPVVDISGLDDSAGVAANAADIANNTTAIGNNATDISNNATNISNNTTAIGNNAINITANTTDIATNATNLANHISADGDLSDTNEIQNIEEVLTDGNDANGLVLTGLGAPTAASDAATKAYVDSVADDDITGVSFDGGTNEVTVSEGGTSFSADLSSLDDSAGVAANAADIANNTTAIGNNATNITANASDIANNTTNISNNASAIATNTSDIANNTTAIGNNATDIANHIAADADTNIGNEYNTGSSITDGVIGITDGGGTESIDLISSDLNNNITFGSDGALYLNVASVSIAETNTSLSYNDATGELTYSNELGNNPVVDISGLDDSAGVAANAADIANNTTAIGNNASNISTNTTNISNNASAIATNTSDIANNTTAIGNNATDISNNTTNISNNVSAIATNTSDIANNTTAIGNNATDIANHIAADADTNIGNEYNTGSSITDGVIGITDGGGTESIDLISSDLNNNITFGSDGALYLNVASVSIAETNTSLSYNDATGELTYSNELGNNPVVDISGLDDSAGVAANAADIANNTTAIGNNAADIANNTTNISNNASAIATNATNISNNTTAIGNNASNITTNASDIANNTTNISNNASAIATNTTDIATNATNLANHISADGDLSDTNEIQNIEEVLTDGNDANGLVLTGLGAPTAASDAATKAYVDSVADDDITGVSFDGGTNEVTVSEGGTSFSADLSSLDDSAGVAANAADIANNTTAIGNNATDISNNATNISNNTTAIGNNATNITANATDIATNATNLANHISADGDLSDTNEIQNIEEVLTDGNDANGLVLTGLGAPTAASDAATKAYVDSVADDDITGVSFDGGTNEVTVSEGGTSFSADLSSLDDSAGVAANAADIANNTTAIGSNATDISNNATNISNNTTAIGNNASDISNNASNITTNTTNISNNAGAIATNTTDIATNATNLANHISADGDLSDTNEIQNIEEVLTDGNDANGLVLTGLGAPTAASDAATKAYVDSVADDDITGVSFDGGTNEVTVSEGGTSFSADLSSLDDSAGVAANAADIANNTTAIGNNATDISNNATNISNNTTAIGNNAANITTNASDIANNTTNISNNASAIATNTTDIATNATNLANHISADGDLSDTNEIQNIEEVLTDGNDANGLVLTGLGAPTVGSDAATKAYVDSVADDDITGVSFDGGTNEVTVSEGGTSFSADLSSLDDSAGVAANAADIANNTTAIGNNASDISNNATNISNNTTAIGNNATNITANATDIATNATNLANHISADGDLSDTNEIQNIEEVLTDGNDANGLVLTGLGAPTAASDAATKAYVDSVADDDITGVSFDGGTNEVTVSEGGTSFSADLSSLDDSAGVAANAADIANNTTAIGNNAVNITTNASDIATNATNLANHISADGDLSDTNEIQNIEEVLTEGNDANGLVLTGLGAPTAASDAATKAYVDSVADDDITGVSFDGGTNEVTVSEGGTSFSADLSSLDDSAGVAANAADIANNTTAIGNNATDISNNATNISNNTTAIGNNTTNISNNAGAIATNTTDIAANATNLANHISADGDLSDTNEINTRFEVNGANLEIEDSNGTLQVPLADINNQDASEVNSDSPVDVDGDGNTESTVEDVIQDIARITSKAARIFYPPSIAIDASTNGTGRTINLYSQYLAQYGSPTVRSAGAPAAIPTYGATELYYYVTYADPTVFANMTIDANGVLTYDIIGQPADYNALINVVFVVK
ncbi:hypothetical protein MACH07_03440 [Flagellimonas marinaquae]|uniref:Trimeric autotransporter adhesin YadA-like stalk domain-containing protein n=5 Tax=Flavobacteriaceae TaxID=49546 RepID=A0AA48HBW4_9FLAO|nr:hypothetical protein MACH07_03440 [Allomuricauda aquimarina]